MWFCCLKRKKRERGHHIFHGIWGRLKVSHLDETFELPSPKLLLGLGATVSSSIDLTFHCPQREINISAVLVIIACVYNYINLI